MDGGDSVSEGNEKYSVLLGSALRNNDVDEFIKIYDTTVPKDLTEDQIKHIKEEARKISELPERDFKKLVASAQDYCKRPATMTDQGLSKSSYSEKNDWKYIDDDDDASPSSVTGKVPSLDLGSIKHHSRHLNNSSTTTSNHVMGNMGKNEFAAALKLHEDDDHNDSGLYCSKTTSESTSDTDQNGSDNDGSTRPGMFHYFKPYANKKTYGSCQPSSNSTVLYHNDTNYDEAYTASDSDIASPEDSPRETTSMLGLGGRGQMTELKTIRIHKPETIGPLDRDDDNDSNDDLTNVNLHKRFYSPISRNSFGSMDNEDNEEYMNSDIDHSRASPWTQKQYSSLAGAGKNFRSYGTGTYTGSSSSSSCKSSLSGDVPRNGPKNNGPRPPFGDPLNVEKIGCSVDDLIPRRGMRDVPDMPASAPITEDRSSEESTKQSEGTKKKKKKKKATKGEGGSMKDGDSVDENGNPVATQQSRKKEISNTLSRVFSTSSRDINTTGTDSYCNSQFLSQTEDIQKFSNGQWMAGVNDDRAEAARKRKQKKLRQECPVMTQDIPNYRGRADLEDILEFIENTGQGKKKKKTVGPSPPIKPLKDNNKSKLSSPLMGSFDNSSDKDDENEVEKMGRDRYRNEPRRLSDLTQKMPLSNHSIRADARDLDKYDLFLRPDNDIPKEAEFQLVTKNKKKKRPTNSVYPFKDFEMQRVPRVYKPIRSVTPPPTKTPTDCLGTPPSAEKPAERAFSPSAFPVLSSDLDIDFPNIRGRRNSTGNAPLEGVTKDDDDLTWVKVSPPPAQDTDVESNSPVSPGGIVKISYAKIAASPKPKNGMPGVISTNSVVSERRHSFGSMDDANQSIKEAVSSLGNKNDPKSQSQELLSNTRIQDDNDRVTARRNLDSAFQPNSTATSAIQSAPPSKVVEPAAGKNTPTMTLSETSQSSNIKSEKATSVTSNPVPGKPCIPSHTGPRVPKRLKAKCVIFLDKKINDMPKNLGITFGFDENEAPSQGVIDNITMDPNVSTSKNTCIEGISFKSEPLEETDGHKLIIPVNGLAIPAQGLHMDQNQQIVQLASESNQNRQAPVCSGSISDNRVKWTSVPEEKMWKDLENHESMLGSASSQYNIEDCVRYLVREWEKVMDAKNKGVALEYLSD